MGDMEVKIHQMIWTSGILSSEWYYFYKYWLILGNKNPAGRMETQPVIILVVEIDDFHQFQ